MPVRGWTGRHGVVTGGGRALWRRLGIVSLACVLLSGCWLQPDFDARHSRSNDLETRRTIDNVATLHQIWSTTPGSAGDARAATMIAVAGSVVYVGAQMQSAGCQVEAYDLAGCPTSPCEPLVTLALSDTGSASDIGAIVVAEGRLLVAHGSVTAFAPA